MKYCGIDLHSNNSVVMITDETDRVVYSKRLPNDLSQILAALEIHRAELSGVVVESTFNWYWLVDGLQEAGYCVHLANTTAIKQYDGLKHRGDESDARQLAHLLRLGLLPQGHIMPKAARAVRDLARKRMQLVQQRTSQILSIESSLSRHTGGRIKSDVIKRLRETDLNEMKLGEMQTLGLKAHVAVMQALQAQIDSLEMVLAQHCRTEPDYRLLKTVDGIGEILATVILLETGRHRTLRGCGQLRLLLPLRGQRAHIQRQEEGRGQYQERQPLPRVGVRRGGEFRGALLRGRAAVLPEEESQTQQHRRDQGGGAQAGARVLSHAQDQHGVFSREVLCVRLATAGEPVMGLGIEPPDLIGCRAVCQRQEFCRK